MATEGTATPSREPGGVAEAYPYEGLPFTAASARWVIGDLYAGKAARRSDIATGAYEEHLRLGGSSSASGPTGAVKKALSVMESLGTAERTPSFGIWRFPPKGEGSALTRGQRKASGPVNSEAGSTQQQVPSSVTVENTVGSGPQCVYVYSFPTYRDAALAAGEQAWPLKVGMSSSRAAHRVLQQVGTSHPEWPVVHLEMRCADARALESALHAALAVRGERMEGSPGNEWFRSSPRWILGFVRSSFPEALV